MSAADPIEALTDDEWRQRTDRRDTHLVATAARERQPVAVDPVVPVGAEDHVRGGVVRVGVHRVRPVEPARGRKADVKCLDPDDGRPIHETPRERDKYPMFDGETTVTAAMICDYAHKDPIFTSRKASLCDWTARVVSVAYVLD